MIAIRAIAIIRCNHCHVEAWSIAKLKRDRRKTTIRGNKLLLIHPITTYNWRTEVSARDPSVSLSVELFRSVWTSSTGACDANSCGRDLATTPPGRLYKLEQIGPVCRHLEPHSNVHNGLQIPEKRNCRLGIFHKVHLTIQLGEYIGTTSFLFIGFATAQIANLPNANSVTSTGAPVVNTSNLLFIATSFGLSLAINAWIFYRVSGSAFNPAVTVALVLIGACPPLRAAHVIVAQILGGITAAGLIQGLTPGPLAVATGLGPDVSIAQGRPSNRVANRRIFYGDVPHNSIGPGNSDARGRKA
jgi:Major intrinsic protein